MYTPPYSSLSRPRYLSVHSGAEGGPSSKRLYEYVLGGNLGAGIAAECGGWDGREPEEIQRTDAFAFWNACLFINCPCDAERRV
jgi:hypothetical protein